MSQPGQQLRILAVRRESNEATTSIVGTIQRSDETIEIYFRFPREYSDFLSPSADPFLAGLTVPAMHNGLELVSDLPVSHRLLRGLGRVQYVLTSWWPKDLQKVSITAAVTDQPPPARPVRAATFFSGGVDSFSTALTHLYEPMAGDPPLTHLVFMHGLEIPLHQAIGADGSEAAVRGIAKELGVECLVGETNLRSFFNPSWGEHWCGTGLAATALSLAGGFTTFYIPSSGRVGQTMNWGSVPLIDESCSTESLEIVNDGPMSRAEKVYRIISRYDVALRNLRFCTSNMGGLGNCGKCRKCQRTMLALEAAGVLDRVSFNSPPVIRPDFWRGNASKSSNAVRATLAIAQEAGAKPWLIEGRERRIRRIERQAGLRQLVHNSPLRHALPLYRTFRRTLWPREWERKDSDPNGNNR